LGEDLLVWGERHPDLLGAPGQCPFYPVALLIGLKGEQRSTSAFPKLKKSVLQKGEPPGLVQHIVQNPVYEARLKFKTHPPGRLLDQLSQPVDAHDAHQELVCRDLLSKGRVRRASLVEVGPERHDQNRLAFGSGRVQQVQDEAAALLFIPASREHLLELVHDNDKESSLWLASEEEPERSRLSSKILS
jgi:hypothetical protein